jgi:hypothetical protein
MAHMATRNALACVRVSQATRRLERMVHDHRPDRVSQQEILREYALNVHEKAVQLHMWRTAERVLQLANQVEN